MKYLELFERYISSNKNLPIESKLKIGDYVQIKNDNNKIYRIERIYEYNEEKKDSKTRFIYEIDSFIDLWKYEYELIFLSNNKEEAEAIVNQNKFNL
jgi:hypothetical protein